MSKETNIRSITKSVLYRLFGTGITILIAFILTGNFPASISIGIIELLSKIILYYVYERIWQKIKWGKNE